MKLPPPLDHRTLYNDLPQYSQPLGGGPASGGLRPPSALGLGGNSGFGKRAMHHARPGNVTGGLVRHVPAPVASAEFLSCCGRQGVPGMLRHRPAS